MIFLIGDYLDPRTFPINCIKGSTKHDIKEVLNPTNTGGPAKEKLLKELMDFRKLLLVYRLKHFKDPIPDLDVGVEGRDKELVKHSIQLFYGSECLKEVIETLQYFLDLKNEKKDSTIESILLQKIVAPLVKHEGSEISSQKIWNEFMEEVPGMLNEKNPNEYHTDDYGTIYRTSTLPSYLGDSFGGKVKHTKKGNVWSFDRDVIESLAKEDKTRIEVSEVKLIAQENGEGVKAVNTPVEGDPDFSEKKSTDNNTKDTSVYLYNASHVSHIPKSSTKIANESLAENYNASQASQESLPESIHRIHPNSDIWKCDNCTLRDDKWGMIRHPYKHNLKLKDKKLGCH
jgi:hypothetical protein